ncbi:MAG TPA: 2Fe-2S iron-sulfur cluster-binding protein, partial [Methylomirabilota bacterium]|nr:2Fe-2S iron-sulfur cluster-binding protein [Methylomirabilota bacterium]
MSPDSRGAAAPLVTLTIDGQQVSVPRGTLIVEAAKKLHLEIPVFCYHHKLDPVGACRLCLVQISPGPPKPQTACTTPVAEGMVVQTNSALTVAARADILEYELVNHPLDCPVCDKGGECPLQDYTFRHGYPTSHIQASRLHFQKPIPLSDRIALDRERCVLCYRCTRYYDEVAWEQELTVDERGVHSYITSQFGQPLQSVFSGNIIDLCPVGALTSRVWRFESRPWDMRHTASICSKCSVGCSVTLWERRNQLVRVTSHENDDIDEGWICDRGRFDYTHVNRPERLRVPRLGDRQASWDEALGALVEATRNGGRKLGISLPQDVTNEELFLLSRLLEGPWKGARVALERRTTLPAPAGEPLRIAELDGCRAVVVVASDTADDVPIVNLRVKKAVAKRGARLLLVHPDEVDLDRWPGAVHVRSEPGQAAAAVRDLAAGDTLDELVGAAGDGAAPVAILWGDGRGSEDAKALAAAVAELAERVGGRAMPLYRGTNERGALAAGLVGAPDDLDGCETVLCWGPPAAGRLP